MKKKNIPVKFLKTIIKQKKSIRVIVNGNSMYPILCDGDYINILIKTKYSVGDVIVFYYEFDKNYLIHRIVARHGKFFYVKGDNAFRIEKIKSKDIIGYVKFDFNGKYKIKEYCKKAYKLGLYARRVKYNMKKIYESHYYIETQKTKFLVK